MAGCEVQTRYDHTSFIPISDTEFVYKVLVINGMTEADRETWMAEEVTKYSMCPDGFDILDKRTITEGEGILSFDREIIRGQCKPEG
ncbi:hypothetical protein [Paremcibacter congregatus]|uniref:hypothetical protein n=1 Tax=Paremcibacter congregatus TaxID=2043170 RepID=UPI003A8EB024